ncbi:type II secretion system protein M [Parasphingopyxis sp. CP4]|uniref:type II secretion system protein GspM n=1 Tax=Parasphingopyxis sp. CP4 TaxID=2724527 RepID=UPI0015A0C79B|nr:type II secretion system protein GspM [Parasphingopyxis sp. CP4]QLC21290.1 type II secretion system protein M [Parasphingopyxis sp. CP4]
MMERIRIWFMAQSLRERWLIGVAGALAVIVLSWLLIIRPIDAMRESAKARHDAAVLALARVETRLAAIEDAAANPSPPLTGRITDIVTAEAVRVGFNTAQADAAGTDGARIVISAARPQTFFGWAVDMETRLGLHVEALVARPNADETLTVDVTFRSGARGQ